MTRFDTTRWSVILGAAAGDRTDREVFCLTYAPVIRAYFSARWRLAPDHEDVADGVQQVFLELFRSDGALNRVDPARGGFRAFLRGVVHYAAANLERSWSRRQRRVKAAGFDPDNVETTQATLSDAFDLAWAKMVMRQARLFLVRRAGQDDEALLRLRCLALRFYDGLPAREIAVRIGRDPTTTYKLIRRAKEEFRVALLSVMATYHSDASEEELVQQCVGLLSLLQR